MELKLSYPVYPYKVNQKFGECDVCVDLITKDVFPKVAGICPKNCADFYRVQGMQGHNGLDIQAYHGQPVYHAGPTSVVSEVSNEKERGIGIGAITVDEYETLGQVLLRYWHMEEVIVRVGDVIEKGQLIGYADNTGSSSGDHLHLEVKPVVRSGDTWTNVYQNNGYFGAIDPSEFWDGYYAHKPMWLERVVNYVRSYCGL